MSLENERHMDDMCRVSRLTRFGVWAWMRYCPLRHLGQTLVYGFRFYWNAFSVTLMSLLCVNLI